MTGQLWLDLLLAFAAVQVLALTGLAVLAVRHVRAETEQGRLEADVQL